MKKCIICAVWICVSAAGVAWGQYSENWESYATISDAIGSGGWVRQEVSSHTIDSVTTASLPRPGAPEPTNKVLRAYNADENLVHTFSPTIGTDANPLVVQIWMYDLGGASSKGVSLIRTLDGGLSSSFHCGIHRLDSGWRRRGTYLPIQDIGGPGAGPGWRLIIMTIKSSTWSGSIWETDGSVLTTEHKFADENGYMPPTYGFNAIALGMEYTSAYKTGSCYFDDATVSGGDTPPTPTITPTVTPTVPPTLSPTPTYTPIFQIDKRYLRPGDSIRDTVENWPHGFPTEWNPMILYLTEAGVYNDPHGEYVAAGEYCSEMTPWCSLMGRRVVRENSLVVEESTVINHMLVCSGPSTVSSVAFLGDPAMGILGGVRNLIVRGGTVAMEDLHFAPLVESATPSNFSRGIVLGSAITTVVDCTITNCTFENLGMAIWLNSPIGTKVRNCRILRCVVGICFPFDGEVHLGDLSENDPGGNVFELRPGGYFFQFYNSFPSAPIKAEGNCWKDETGRILTDEAEILSHVLLSNFPTPTPAPGLEGVSVQYDLSEIIDVVPALDYDPFWTPIPTHTPSSSVSEGWHAYD